MIFEPCGSSRRSLPTALPKKSNGFVSCLQAPTSLPRRLQQNSKLAPALLAGLAAAQLALLPAPALAAELLLPAAAAGPSTTTPAAPARLSRESLGPLLCRMPRCLQSRLAAAAASPAREMAQLAGEQPLELASSWHQLHQH